MHTIKAISDIDINPGNLNVGSNRKDGTTEDYLDLITPLLPTTNTICLVNGLHNVPVDAVASGPLYTLRV